MNAVTRPRHSPAPGSAAPRLRCPGCPGCPGCLCRSRWPCACGCLNHPDLVAAPVGSSAAPAAPPRSLPDRARPSSRPRARGRRRGGRHRGRTARAAGRHAVPGAVIGALIALIIKPGARLAPGIEYASTFLLQCSVVLLDTQLSIEEAARVGVASLP